MAFPPVVILITNCKKTHVTFSPKWLLWKSVLSMDRGSSALSLQLQPYRTFCLFCNILLSLSFSFHHLGSLGNWWNFLTHLCPELNLQQNISKEVEGRTSLSKLVMILWPAKLKQVERPLIHGCNLDHPIWGSNLWPFDYKKASKPSQTGLLLPWLYSLRINSNKTSFYRHCHICESCIASFL